jgi:hypothetical protein
MISDIRSIELGAVPMAARLGLILITLFSLRRMGVLLSMPSAQLAAQP